MIKISSFNVNSIKARLPNLLQWLKNSQPDIVCLQELKCVESEFPFEVLFDVGYNAVVSGQKSYNGVAILSKFKIEDVVKTLPKVGKATNLADEETKDEQARYIEAVIALKNGAIRVASIYVPNGGGDLIEGEKLEDSQKFRYKLEFFQRLRLRFEELSVYDEMQVFGGDFNVAQEEIDVFDPKSWDGSVCFNLLERQQFRSLLNLGFIDSYRVFNPTKQEFTWWDYRGGAWQHNKGLRIDYLLLSPKAADCLISASVEDRGVRDQDKPSDHCPVSIEINSKNCFF